MQRGEQGVSSEGCTVAPQEHLAVGLPVPHAMGKKHKRMPQRRHEFGHEMAGSSSPFARSPPCWQLLAAPWLPLHHRDCERTVPGGKQCMSTSNISADSRAQLRTLCEPSRRRLWSSTIPWEDERPRYPQNKQGKRLSWVEMLPPTAKS